MSSPCTRSEPGSVRGRSSEFGQVSFGVVAVLPLLVEDDDEALLERERLDLRPSGFGLRHLGCELFFRERFDDIADHRLPLSSHGEHGVEGWPRFTVPGNA